MSAINYIVLILCSLSISAPSNYEIVNKISLPGEGFWDYITANEANGFKVLETVPTQRSARTIALDKTTHHLYLPAAEFESAPSENNRRPAIKPNSFTILDIETLN